jgi:hypothetical protein
MFPAFAAHEVGHGLGLSHSYDNSGQVCALDAAPGEYCDPFDIMSAMVTKKFDALDFPPAGPGVNVPNLITLGQGTSGSQGNSIIPRNKIAFFHIASSPQQKIRLAALSHPLASGVLTVIIAGFSLSDFYTVEYRQADGWDAGLKANGVLVHEFNQASTFLSAPYSFLQDRDAQLNNGKYFANEHWTAPSAQVAVWVCSVDPSGGTATVSVGAPELFGSPCQ